MPSTHLTKDEILVLMTEISDRLKKLNRSNDAPNTRMRGTLRLDDKRDLVFDIFLKLIHFYKISDKLVSIEGSQTSLKCLLLSAKLVSTFFDASFSKLPATQIETLFPEFHVARNLTDCDVAVSATWRTVSDVARTRHAHYVEVKKACQEQKAFRESFLKTQTDFDIDLEDHDGAEQETRLLSIEDAVLIIQKLERKYQSISRRNYVRFVRERAAELHGKKSDIDATQAAIRIQARTRGYFARKLVREMREKELNILYMTPESYIRAKCAEKEEIRRRKERSEAERILQIEDVPTELSVVLESLKSNFFLSTDDLPEPSRPPKLGIQMDTVFRDACFRGIVSPQAAIELDELISQPELCRIDNRSFRFDLRSFLTLTVCVPLSLASWKSKQPIRWLLLSGDQDSGKTAWTRGIARACHVTHVHVSKNVVNMGKRRIYSVIRKLAKQEKRLVVSIDRVEILKKETKQKGNTHRQLLLRSFLTDLRATSVTVIAMTKLPVEELDSFIVDSFPLQVTISNPSNATRYDLAVDCLSRNMEQERLSKIPQRLFDIEKQTDGFSNGKAAKFVTNRWSAANNKTNLS